jgi:short-subunit dehydrogenase
MKRALIVGGTSGLGLELARMFSVGSEVIVTGRKDPKIEGLLFRDLNIGYEANKLGRQVESVTYDFDKKPVDLVVYAAGFFQEGTIDKIHHGEMIRMMSIGVLLPAILIQKILELQQQLPHIIAITSTSQWTPRKDEPVYTAAKAGLGMLMNSLSLDERIGDVMVAAPSGMNTRFWKGSNRDTSTMLDPTWVAEQIITYFVAKKHYKYRFIKLLRNPQKVVIAEERE